MVQIQMTNAKKGHLRIALKSAETYFIERELTYKKIGGDFLIFYFYTTSCKINMF